MRFVLFLNVMLSVCLLKTGDPEAPGVDYLSAFGDHWVNAEQFVKENEGFFKARADHFGISYGEVISIVFPELVRYSAIRNKIEVTLLKTLYVYKGPAYADFSIGVFQMKPSFAERIRNEANASGDTSILALFGGGEFIPGERDHRRRIVLEMETPAGQFNYLLAFYLLCEKKFNLAETVEIPEKIRFYATAYNCGFFNSEEYIRAKLDKKFFSVTTLKTGPFYSYSDIAAFYYKSNFKQTGYLGN